MRDGTKSGENSESTRVHAAKETGERMVEMGTGAPAKSITSALNHKGGGGGGGGGRGGRNRRKVEEAHSGGEKGVLYNTVCSNKRGKLSHLLTKSSSSSSSTHSTHLRASRHSRPGWLRGTATSHGEDSER